MSVALLAMSHSPLLGINDPKPEVNEKLQAGFEEMKKYAADFNPDVVLVFTPDHFNGFFYDLMPPFCIGFEAHSMGDYKTSEGPLNVPEDIAADLAQFVINEGIDMSISREMVLDHGGAQPVEQLFGSLDAVPVIPIFVNGVARPFAPMHRIREMGQAVGKWAKAQDKKVLMIASGGLSHDPPLPRWDGADDHVKDFLLHGHKTQEERDAREARVTEAGKNAGKYGIQDINPEWDQKFLDDCGSAEPARFDEYTADQMDEDAGHSSHEVRTWVAAFSALAESNGKFNVDFKWYEPIPEFVAGFGMMAAK